MKELLLEIIFTIIGLALFFGMLWLAELLGKVININTVMTTAYVVGVLSFIYLIKN